MSYLVTNPEDRFSRNEAHIFLHTRRSFRDFARADKFYLPYPYHFRGIDKKNTTTYCQYTGCVGGQVTLSLRRWELTSLRRHIRRQLSIWRTSTWLVNGASYLKIKCWRSKDMQENESVRIEKAVPRDHCLPNSDFRTDVSIRTSYSWKILTILYMYIL